jgi:hypothetical protein
MYNHGLSLLPEKGKPFDHRIYYRAEDAEVSEVERSVENLK